MTPLSQLEPTLRRPSPIVDATAAEMRVMRADAARVRAQQQPVADGARQVAA